MDGWMDDTIISPKIDGKTRNQAGPNNLSRLIIVSDSRNDHGNESKEGRVNEKQLIIDPFAMIMYLHAHANHCRICNYVLAQ